ncbi:MAG TPA: hypothetical protein VHO24_18585 [Opitutaceae bacterium]|nr:hypothetical protein [Opitutaceae bacterium]
MPLQPPPSFHRRILNTILFLLLFRFLANIPVANVDEEKLQELLKTNPLLGAIDLFAGGEVLSNFSVVAVGLFPYLLAAGLVGLAARLVPALRSLEKESEAERFKLYTRIVTLPLAFLLGWGITRYLSLQTGLFPDGLKWFSSSSFLPTLLIVAAVTLGSWLTEKIKEWITDHGIASGESVILLVGSSLAFVSQVSDIRYQTADAASALRALAIHGAVGLLVILLAIPLATAVRKIPMILAKRAGAPPPPWAARQPVYSPHLPLLLNRGGIAPVSSAIGFLLLFQIGALFLGWVSPGKFPQLHDGLLSLADPERELYWALLAVLIVVFTYFHNYLLLWKPYENSEQSLADYLKTNGSAFIPGFRPGSQTAAYLSRVMALITLPGAVLLVLLTAVLPYAILKFTGQNAFVPILSAIVFVKTFLQVRRSFEAHRIMDHGYDDLLRPKKKNLR